MTRAQAIAAYCRGCIADPAAPGTWREQVAVCSAPSCELWKWRPLPARAPAWLRSRDPVDLPAGWMRLHQEVAVRGLRAKIAGKAANTPETGPSSTPSAAGNAEVRP